MLTHTIHPSVENGSSEDKTNNFPDNLPSVICPVCALRPRPVRHGALPMQLEEKNKAAPSISQDDRYTSHGWAKYRQ